MPLHCAKLFVLTLALTALALPAHAENSFTSAGETGQWIMEYYKKPEPHRLADALIILAESKGIPEDGQKLIFSFMGAALAEAPKVHDQFFKAVGKHDKARYYALPCFWFMPGDAGKPLLERAKVDWADKGVGEVTEQFLKSTSPNLLEGPVKNALHLDHLWSTFFATGKPEPVLKVISALALINDKHLDNHVTGQSAQWSLKANARMHPVVHDIIETTLRAIQEPLKSRLARTIEP